MRARRAILALLDRMLGAVMAHGPGALAHGVSGLAGRYLGARLYPRGAQRARAGLDLLRPELPPQAALAEMWDNMARSVMEVPRLTRMYAEGRIHVRGSEHLAGRPLLVAGLHLGNWEFIALAMGRHAAAPTAVYQPPLSDYRHRAAIRERSKFVRRLLPGSPAVTRTALRVLTDDRDVLLIFMDELRNGIVNAPAFGRPPTQSGNIATIARMAHRAGAGVVLAHTRRSPGPRIAVTFEPPLHMTGDVATDIGMLNAAAEAIVLPALPQWFMLHEWRSE